MNPHQFIDDDGEPNVVEFSENPGRRLRVQRQSRGLEIERVAAQLHLRPAVVEALEQDHYPDLPDPVFVSGYIRNYARLLGLDPAPLIAAYRATHPAAQATTPRMPGLSMGEIGGGHIVVRLVSVALLIGVVWMLVLWWQDRGATFSGLLDLTASTDSATLPATTSADGGASAISEDPATDFNPPEAASAIALPPIDTGREPASFDEPDAISVSAPSLPLPLPPPTSEIAVSRAPLIPSDTGSVSDADEPEAAAPADPEAVVSGPPEVALSFSGPCWISVKDAYGNVVLTGTMRSGDHRVLDGKPPYRLQIGAVGNTTMTVGGKPYDLNSHSKGNVAHFTLDPEGNG